MTEADFRELLARIQAGKLTAADAWQSVEAALSPTAITMDALVDLDRSRRCGYPEVVFGPGKTPDAIVRVFKVQEKVGQNSFATRVTSEQAEAILKEFPHANYNALAKTVMQLNVQPPMDSVGKVAVVTAGTGDHAVAQEAVETASWMGCSTTLVLDVGVAGPHRIVQYRHFFADCDAVVVVAGMEGALPSVVAGWVAVPVIAVPTSVGYGANLGGVAALLSMLNSCAANVCVVNIDAGFKGGFLAGLVANNASAKRR